MSKRKSHCLIWNERSWPCIIFDVSKVRENIHINTNQNKMYNMSFHCYTLILYKFTALIGNYGIVLNMVLHNRIRRCSLRTIWSI